MEKLKRLDFKKAILPVALGVATVAGMGMGVRSVEVHAENVPQVKPIVEVVPTPPTVFMREGTAYKLAPYDEQQKNPITPVEKVLFAFAAGAALGIFAAGPINYKIHKDFMHNDPNGEHVKGHHKDYLPKFFLKSIKNMESIISFANDYRVKLVGGASAAAAVIGLAVHEIPFAGLSAETASAFGGGIAVGLTDLLGAYEFYHLTTHDQGFLRSYINLNLGEQLQKSTGLKEVRVAYPTLIDIDRLIVKAEHSRKNLFDSEKSLKLLQEFVEQVNQNQKGPAIPKFTVRDAQIMIFDIAKQVANQEALAQSQGYGKFKDIGDRVLSYLAHDAPYISERQRRAARHHKKHHDHQNRNYTLVTTPTDTWMGTKLPSSRDDLIKDVANYVVIDGFAKGRYAVQPGENTNKNLQPLKA